MPPGVTIHRSRETARGFQVYSNLTYVAAGLVGMGLGAGGQMQGPRRTAVAARVTMILVGIMVVATGLVSTWYHRAGTSDDCQHGTIKRVCRIDVGCAVSTSIAGVGVLLPLTAVGLARQIRVAPIVLIVFAGLMGGGALAIHMDLTRNRTQQLDPVDYDAKHGLWHVLGASAAAFSFVAAFLALRPSR
jgi:hypothetical protein